MCFLFMACRYEKEGLKAKTMQKIANIWKKAQPKMRSARKQALALSEEEAR